MDRKTSISFTSDEAKLLDEAQKEMGARSMAEAVRRSIVQASALRKKADSEGNITIVDEDGNRYVFPLKAL